MAITGINHIAMRVKDLDAAIESYTKLGMTLTRTTETPGIGKQAFFELANGTFIELVAPTSPDSAVGKAIASRGEGVHVMALRVEDLDQSVTELTEKGVRIIPGGDNAHVAFVHPKSAHGVLLELLEKH